MNKTEIQIYSFIEFFINPMKCFLGMHKWEIAERLSRKGDFISGWSPIYCYEKCERCGKEKKVKKGREWKY